MLRLSSKLVNEINELCTLDDCKEAWKLVKDRWREIENETSFSATKEFKIGDGVKFVGRGKRVLYGKIVKKNPKTAQVDCDEDRIWNVGYTILEKT